MPGDAHAELPLDPDQAALDPAEDAGAAAAAPAATPRPAHARLGLWLAVAAGGLLGTPLRYLLSVALPTPATGWPTATFVVNLAGAFVLGALLEGLARGGADVGWRRALRLFGGTGMCGALTTYSTLAVEVDLLAGHGRWGLAVGYGCASVVAGIAAAAAGVAVAAGGHGLHGRRRKAARAATAGARSGGRR